MGKGYHFLGHLELGNSLEKGEAFGLVSDCFG